MKSLQQKIILIIRNFYALIILMLVILVVLMGNFLHKHVYDTIYNSQLVSLFRPFFELPAINEELFHDIENHISKKKNSGEYKWNQIKNPFEKLEIIEDEKSE